MTDKKRLVIEQFPCLSDNYGFLIHDTQSGQTAAIDTPDAATIREVLKQRGWHLTHIFNTHHHPDHTGGNVALKRATNCHIIGPAGEADKIPALDEAVDEGDIVSFGTTQARVLNVGGHTLGHIAYYFAEEKIAFVGDTLFELGCGRLFEGTPAQMWESLQKIAALPPDTILYCAHEYTQANARFAIKIEPDNVALQKRCRAIDKARAANQPTVPMQLADELATNPFLRADQKSIRQRLAMTDANPVDIFAEIRHRKDNM